MNINIEARNATLKSLHEAQQKESHNGDLEQAHYDADKAICNLLNEIGYSDVVK